MNLRDSRLTDIEDHTNLLEIESLGIVERHHESLFFGQSLDRLDHSFTLGCVENRCRGGVDFSWHVQLFELADSSTSQFS